MYKKRWQFLWLDWYISKIKICGYTLYHADIKWVTHQMHIFKRMVSSIVGSSATIKSNATASSYRTLGHRTTDISSSHQHQYHHYHHQKVSKWIWEVADLYSKIQTNQIKSIPQIFIWIFPELIFCVMLFQHTPLYFVIMRLNLKLVLVILCLAVCLFTLSIWSHCGDLTIARGFLPKWNRRYSGISMQYLCFVY